MDDKDLAERLAQGLNRLGAALRVAAWHQADRRGLSRTQAEILSYLASREGESAPSQIARALGVTAATVSDSLVALADKGLVSRHRDGPDARRVNVALTMQGRRAVRALKSAPDPLVHVAESLNAVEQRVLLKAVMKAIRQLQEEQHISPAAMCVNCAFFEPYRYRDPEKPHHCAFVNGAFGDASLRIDCPDFELAAPGVRAQNAKRFER